MPSRASVLDRAAHGKMTDTEKPYDVTTDVLMVARIWILLGALIAVNLALHSEQFSELLDVAHMLRSLTQSMWVIVDVTREWACDSIPGFQNVNAMVMMGMNVTGL